jgi:hypothetical protein
MQGLGKLPNLTILHMWYSSSDSKGQEFVFKQGSFPSLALLKFYYMRDVVCIKFEDGTMSKLELLRIWGWKDLQELSGLRYLTKLKEIRLEDLGPCKDNVQEQLAEHPNSNVVVIRS